jgi:tetratricopeptide (TPR) repeat protein
MKMTLHTALQKGIEAHKAGHIQEAERLYAAVLKAQPEHPDANHNMGMLVASVGQIQESLPYFKMALDSNPLVVQFWLSYIDALIQLDRISDANAALDEAKGKGFKGEALYHLEKRISEPNASAQEPSSEELQSIINLYLQGQLQSALSGANQLLERFPNSIDLYNVAGASNAGLKQFDAAIGCYKNALEISPEYADAYNNMGVALNAKGDLESAINSYKQAVKIRPEYTEAYNNMGNSLQKKGDLEAAINCFTKAIKIKPSDAESHNNLAIVLNERGDLEAAINSYKQAIKIKPDYPEAFNNMGNSLQHKGDFEAAIECFNQAIKIRPAYSEAYYNLGNALSRKGDPVASIDSYKKALKINPDYVEAYNGMGDAQQNDGDPEAAIKSYKKTLKIKPDNAVAFNNMGIALSDIGDRKAAEDSYKQALKVKPNYAEAAWNLSGLTEHISDSKRWIEHCIQSDQSHLEATLMLSALSYYEGDKSDFNNYMQSKLGPRDLKDHPFMRSFYWAFNLPELPALYFHRWALFDDAVEHSKKTRPFYEFGVWRGMSFRYLIKTFKKGFGFDTFKGLPEDWHSKKSGSYSSGGNIPQVEGGEFIVGEFEDTLMSFFAEPRPMASVINFDADLYSSTMCALNYSKPVIDQHTILIFDEFIMNQNWEQDEYKALNEFCLLNGCSYEVLAISFMTKQVVVKLIGI